MTVQAAAPRSGPERRRGTLARREEENALPGHVIMRDGQWLV